MRKSKYSEEQIIGLLKQVKAGMPVAEVCRKGGFCDATFYKWRSKFGGMEASDAQRLRELEAENAKIKKLLARTVNELWSMDFVSDSLSNGKRLKCLSVADDFSHECVDITVDYGISGE